MCISAADEIERSDRNLLSFLWHFCVGLIKRDECSISIPSVIQFHAFLHGQQATNHFCIAKSYTYRCFFFLTFMVWTNAFVMAIANTILVKGNINVYIQGVSGGIVNILGGGIMDYSE